MFAFSTYQQRHPHDQARATYEREVERLAFLTQEHERQRRRAEAAAHQAAVAAYVEEQERRQRQAAFEHAVQLEVERRRREEQQARLVIEAALARRRAQEQEREAALRHRQAVLEAAQRRAVLIAREQHRRRLEAEQEQRRRVVEARRQQQQQQRTRQAQLPQALFQLFLDLASSSEPEEHGQQAEQRPVVEAPPAVKPVSPPAPPPAPAVPSTAAAEPALPDPAAEAIQRRFEREVARQAALDTLNCLTSDLDVRLSSFSAPASLTFQSSSTSASTSTPPLAFGKPNSSFLGHEDFLVSLLSKIDAVSSGGDKVIKQARKDLVKRVEAELAQLDSLKEHEWERQSQRAASEAGDRDAEPAAQGGL